DLLVELIRRTNALVLLFEAVHLGTRWLVLPPRVDSAFIKATNVLLLVQIGIWGAAAIDFWAKSYLEKKNVAGERSSVGTIRMLVIAARVLLAILIGLGILG